jgi:uncharacterized protein YtpQ (UPF0354 family)
MEPIDVKTIYPRLKAVLPRGVPADVVLSADDSPVSSPFAGDLSIFYAIDKGPIYEFISEKTLRLLTLSKEELHRLAVDNLTQTEKEIRLHKGDNFFFVICDGNLEATLVLHEGIWDYVSEQIGGDVLVSVPARDLLLISGTKKEEISALKKKACECIEKVDHPLSSKLFLRIGNGWKEYDA